MDFAALESRFKTVEGDVYSALERDAHSKIGEILIEAAKGLAPFIPGGPEAEQIVSQLVNIADTAHNVIHTAAGTNDPLAGVATVAAGAAQIVDEVKTDVAADTAS